MKWSDALELLRQGFVVYYNQMSLRLKKNEYIEYRLGPSTKERDWHSMPLSLSDLNSDKWEIVKTGETDKP